MIWVLAIVAVTLTVAGVLWLRRNMPPGLDPRDRASIARHRAAGRCLARGGTAAGAAPRRPAVSPLSDPQLYDQDQEAQ